MARPSAAESHSTLLVDPQTHVLPQRSFYLCVCVCLTWREKRKMYCNHDYLLPRVGTLWILCAVTACVCEFNVSGWIFLAHLSPSVFTWFMYPPASSWRGRFSCCAVIPQTSVQKSIEYKINKISLFIDSIFPPQMNASLFCLLFMVVSCCAVSCSLPCECVRVVLRRCPTSCYSQRIKTWGEKKKRITPAFWCWTDLQSWSLCISVILANTVHENCCWQWGCKWKGLFFLN